MRRLLIPLLALSLSLVSLASIVSDRVVAQTASPSAVAPLEANKALVRRFFEIANSSDFDALTEVIAPDFVIHTAPPGEDPGLTGLVLNLTLARTGLPDLSFQIDDLFAEGNTVVVRTTIRGTHLGDLFGAPPTGRTIETQAIDLWHVADGVLAENWHLEDFLSVMQQVGTIPNGGEAAPPAAAPAATPATAAATSADPTDAAALEANKALAQRFHAEIFEQGNLAVADEILASDFVWHNEVAPGAAGVKEFATGVRAAFPDLRLTADQVVAEGDRVAILWTLSGTHQAEFFGVPPSGASVTTPGIDIYRIEDGKIAEVWTVADDLGLLIQLGAIPGPGPEPAATPAA